MSAYTCSVAHANIPRWRSPDIEWFVGSSSYHIFIPYQLTNTIRSRAQEDTVVNAASQSSRAPYATYDYLLSSGRVPLQSPPPPLLPLTTDDGQMVIHLQRGITGILLTSYFSRRRINLTRTSQRAGWAGRLCTSRRASRGFV